MDDPTRRQILLRRDGGPGREGGFTVRTKAENGVVIGKARLVAEIEDRVGIEDLQACQRKEEQADRPAPVGAARPRGLAVDQGAGRFGGRHGGLLEGCFQGATADASKKFQPACKFPRDPI